MDLVDQLARLEDLRLRGVLDEDEFRRAKDRLLSDQASVGDIPVASAMNRLRRSRSDRWIGGVCGGFAALTGVEAWVWRLTLTLLALFGGTGVLLYLLLWIFVPEEH